MQPPPSPSIPIDPALALYPPYYSYQQQQQHLPHHLSLPPNYSSPSSNGSDTIGTPPAEHMPFPANGNGKRPASAAMSNDSRKKSRKDDDSDVARSPTIEKEEPKAKPTRGSRACTSGNHECVFEESNRGKRSSKKHELLTRSIRKMEKTLDTVLRSIGNPTIASGMISRSPSPSTQTATTQALLGRTPSPPPSPFRTHPGSPKLHSLPDNALNPLGLLAEASLANRRATSSNSAVLTARPTSKDGPQSLGVASVNYFRPGPMTILPLRRLYIERQVQPEMLSFTTTEDVVALFNIFFDNMGMFANLLDRNFHTPSLVCSRSPFLLTTTSKFYSAKPELHPKLSELSKKLAFSVPAHGYKSVEIVQAYLLLVLWGCGAVERYEQDRTWLLLGMAIRMATDLNLHRKTAVSSQDTEEGRARDKEVRNRERTWLMCFCLDRSFSAQLGKPHTIKEDCIIRNVKVWCRAPNAIPTDTSLAGYADLQRILARCLDLLYSGTNSASGLQVDMDYLLVIKTMEASIISWKEEWSALREETNPRLPQRVIDYRNLISQFYFNYAMLVLNAFGLQNALERNNVDMSHFFARCHSWPSGFMKHAPDSHCVLTSYAVLSLLKLIRPEFQAYLQDEQKTLNLVNDVAAVLESVSASPTHTPALYGGFLRALISARLETSPNFGFGETTNNSTTVPIYAEGETTSPQRSGFVTPGGFANGLNHNSVPFALDDFQFEGEMGPVADMSTFPPTMAATTAEDNMGGLTMDNFLTSGFWDSVLVPGYSNTMEALSGGFVFGAGGSGLITPRLGITPIQSGTNTPSRGHLAGELTQTSINAAFRASAPPPEQGSSPTKVES
ncbi:hypothetical protein ONZ45_g5575 [Pleurotus djamor]|nr:hypothetical protein ONZ45_g5575 [Pleurotus djamor]